MRRFGAGTQDKKANGEGKATSPASGVSQALLKLGVALGGMLAAMLALLCITQPFNTEAQVLFLGTMLLLALGLTRLRARISLMLLFVFFAARMNFEFGFATLLIAHITFDVPYVVLNVMPKLAQMDPNIYDAALDLGCSPIKALRKVVLPEILPGVFSGFIMSFTYSLDDFVVSYFTSGPTTQTLPITIYSMTRRKVSPEINALSTLLFLVVVTALLIRSGAFRVMEKRRERQ